MILIHAGEGNQLFLQNGTWSPPENVDTIRVLVVGGGGGGSNNDGYFGGGGSGYVTTFQLTYSPEYGIYSQPQPQQVVVGKGGYHNPFVF